MLINEVMYYKKDYYKKSEIESILSILPNGKELDSVTVADITLNDDTINSIVNSFILSATISENLLSHNELIIPVAAYDEENDIIDQHEISALLKAMQSFGIALDGDSSEDYMGVVTPQSFEDGSGNIDADKVTIVTNSIIMRATITSKVDSDSSSHIYVDVLNAISEIKYNTSNVIYILTAEEIKNLLVAFNTLSSSADFTIQLSIDTLADMDEADVNTILDSSIMHNMVNDLMAIYLVGTIEVEVYDIKTSDPETTIFQLTSEEITSFLRNFI